MLKLLAQRAEADVHHVIVADFGDDVHREVKNQVISGLRALSGYHAESDVWDGVNLDFYSKIKIRVQTLDGDTLAWLYVLDAYEGGLPSAERLSILVDAALKAGAPADYIDWVRARPSNPPSAPHA